MKKNPVILFFRLALFHIFFDSKNLIRDILSGLIITFVGESRYVLRPWRAILTDPDFIETHFEHYIYDQ